MIHYPQVILKNAFNTTKFHVVAKSSLRRDLYTTQMKCKIFETALPTFPLRIKISIFCLIWAVLFRGIMYIVNNLHNTQQGIQTNTAGS